MKNINPISAGNHKKFNSLIIIDDEPDCCFLIKCFNERWKIATHFYEFNTVDEALIFIENNLEKKLIGKENIFLVDLNLPVKNGYDFLDAFRDRFLMSFKPLIFVLTGSDRIQDKVRASKHDIDGYLLKPFTEKKLMAMLSITT
ncbi:MAG: response regulator [Bacteroidia bacterium]